MKLEVFFYEKYQVTCRFFSFFFFFLNFQDYLENIFFSLSTPPPPHLPRLWTTRATHGPDLIGPQASKRRYITKNLRGIQAGQRITFQTFQSLAAIDVKKLEPRLFKHLPINVRAFQGRG